MSDMKPLSEFVQAMQAALQAGDGETMTRLLRALGKTHVRRDPEAKDVRAAQANDQE